MAPCRGCWTGGVTMLLAVDKRARYAKTLYGRLAIGVSRLYTALKICMGFKRSVQFEPDGNMY